MNYSNIDIINSLRPYTSENYQNNVPIATKDNLSYFIGDGFSPTYANEFLTVLTNLIVVQRVFDPLSFKNPFDIFYRQTNPLGDTEEILWTDVNEGEDYGDNNSPFEANKPKVGVSYIQTKDKKVWSVNVKDSILRGAFASDGGLSSLIAQIISRLRQEKELYLYGVVKTDLANIDTAYAVEPLDIADTTDAKTLWKQILKLVSDMKFPSRFYNSAHVMANTNQGNFILVLNSLTKSVLDVEVVASLFNSSEIGANKYFSTIITLPIVADNTIGYIMDRDTYLIVDRILTTTSQYNARTLAMNYFMHNWIKRGFNPAMQAVKLVDNTTSYSSLMFSPSDTLDFTTTLDVEFKVPEVEGATGAFIIVTDNGKKPTISDLTWSANDGWTASEGKDITVLANEQALTITKSSTLNVFGIENKQNSPKVTPVLTVTYTKKA